jgi:replicative DNA helicase
MLQDLRGSGQVEHDADVVMLLHRIEMFEYEPLHPGEVDIIVAKHRNGPLADVFARFLPHYGKFLDHPPTY